MIALNLQQLIWCNSYIGTTRKSWNNNMSFFILGYKFDVFFLNLTYTHFLLMKGLYIIKDLTWRKKIIIFITSKITLNKSKIMKKNRKKKKKFMRISLRFLKTLTITNWVFGLLTNFKRVNKKKKVIPIKVLPMCLFMLTNKITDDADYLNIVKEAHLLQILTFGLVDTDQNPLIYDYPVPSNSKAVETTKFYYRLYSSYFFIINLKRRAKYYTDLITQL